jgi:DNA replication factor GINS
MPPLLEPLTYEEVTEVYRKEQKTKNVTEIRKDFYPALRGLLDRLRKENEKEMTQERYSTKSVLLGNQIKKISDKAIQIFDFRAEKIMLAALRAAGGAKVEVDRLTEEEKVLFDCVMSLVQERRALVLELETKTKEELVGRSTQPEEVPAATSAEAAAPRSDKADDDVGLDEGITGAFVDKGAPDEIEVGIQEEPSPAPSRQDVQKSLEDYLVLRILEDIPSFAGPGRDYRLSKEDIVTLPTAIARALIGRGKAVEITPIRFL